jgi:hypothetical protein
MNTAKWRWMVVGLGLLGLTLGGCANLGATPPPGGAVFYCGGAGGGQGITNWGLGVKKGLENAGYPGVFSEFDWETHLGVIADQEESVKAKRAEGVKLAKQVADYRRANPNSPINLMGLSAGTAIVLYTLEALPVSTQIDGVAMLSSSVSADYDMTAALQRVRGNMYVTTSPNDTVLGELAPLFGTADRKYVGQNIAGLTGFQMPPNATPITRRQYSKVVNLAWDPSFDKFGDYGAHTDTAKPEFVQHVVVPLLLKDGPVFMRVHPAGTGGTYQPVAKQ